MSPRGVYERTGPSPLLGRSWVNVPLTDRALDKVIFDDGCWEWAGSHTKYGYGKIRSGGVGTPIRDAHRVVYEICRGPIPDGLWIDHLCRNPGCVRPDHLEPVTPGENTRRGKRVG